MKNLIDNPVSQKLLSDAQSSKMRILLPEDDIRIEEAKEFLLDNNFNIIDLNNEKINDYIEYVSKFKFTSNWTDSMLKTFLDNPVNLSCVMLACNDADGVVAGARTSTSEVIRTAIRLVGINKKTKWVSSMFLMISPDYKQKYSFSDCAVIPEPDIDQLVNIAYEASMSYHLLTSNEPKVAFLSFSTNGSASHYRIDKIKDAAEKFSKQYPNILSEGEIQFDAAIMPDISKKKIPNSTINGEANVFIFPNLDAGNIGYKIAQRLAGYYAWGPLLQGLNKPVNDLSRGCSVQDIINIASITALQSKYNANI